MIYCLFLCKSCAYLQFPAGRRGEVERRNAEVLVRLQNTGGSTAATRTSCTNKNWVWFVKKTSVEAKPLHTYQPINLGKELFAVPGRHVNKCSCTVKPYPTRREKVYPHRAKPKYVTWSLQYSTCFITRLLQRLVSCPHQGTEIGLLLGKEGWSLPLAPLTSSCSVHEGSVLQKSWIKAFNIPQFPSFPLEWNSQRESK